MHNVNQEHSNSYATETTSWSSSEMAGDITGRILAALKSNDVDAAINDLECAATMGANTNLNRLDLVSMIFNVYYMATGDLDNIPSDVMEKIRDRFFARCVNTHPWTAGYQRDVKLIAYAISFHVPSKVRMSLAYALQKIIVTWPLSARELLAFAVAICHEIEGDEAAASLKAIAAYILMPFEPNAHSDPFIEQTFMRGLFPATSAQVHPS